MIEIDKLIMEAMKAKDEPRKETLRGIKSEFLKWKTAKENVGKEFDEVSQTNIIKKMVKQRQDSIDMYLAGNRQDLADKETVEMTILKEFLPAEVSKEQLEKAMHELINDNVAEPVKKNMGVFVKALKSGFPGADGKLVAQVVSSKLS